MSNDRKYNKSVTSSKNRLIEHIQNAQNDGYKDSNSFGKFPSKLSSTVTQNSLKELLLRNKARLNVVQNGNIRKIKFDPNQTEKVNRKNLLSIYKKMFGDKAKLKKETKNI